MRPYSALHPTEQLPVPPDTIGVAIITTAFAVVAQDWPTGARFVSFDSTASFYANLMSTAVNVPTTNSSGTTASSGLNAISAGNLLRQVSTGLSTGYSLTAPTSGVITASFWK